MNEASKTRSLRAPDFVLQYLSGRVIDIGCGNDLVVPHAEPFDRRHGDASQILSYRPPASFDCVHSSHCLEHMPDVPAALRQWWDLVRPGGCMIIVVPHEDLYEQGVWPSLFNPDHKATFRLGSSASWSPVSYDLAALATQLPGARIAEVCLHDRYYERLLSARPGQRHNRQLVRFVQRVRYALSVLRLNAVRLDRFIMKLSRALGIAVDQTLGRAAAQIQIVAVKAPR